jgi:hypothetical protein
MVDRVLWSSRILARDPGGEPLDEDAVDAYIREVA